MDSQLSLFDQVRSHELFADLAPHIVERFWKFHTDNPHVYELFRAYCMDLRNLGRKNYGAKAVMERIRWHLDVEVQGDEFKVNNNYTSGFTRLLVMLEPEFGEFFRMRKGAA